MLLHYEQDGFIDIFSDEGKLFSKEDAAAEVEAVPGLTFRGFKQNDTVISIMGDVNSETLDGLKQDLYHCQLTQEEPVALELPGMWDESDLSGGETDT